MRLFLLVLLIAFMSLLQGALAWGTCFYLGIGTFYTGFICAFFMVTTAHVLSYLLRDRR